MNPLIASMNVPFAVHIGQDMIGPWWCAWGYAVAALMMVWGAWRTREEEIPRIAIMTAAFFVASSIHVPVPGGPPAHLLLTGLVGVVLGRRSALAIPVGLFLQAVLFQHGALSTLGANVCVMLPPALTSWLLFKFLCKNVWLRRTWCRAALIGASVFTFFLTSVYALALLVSIWGADVKLVEMHHLIWASHITFNPGVLLGALAVACLAVWLERLLQNATEFPLGLVIGELSVLLTLLLNALFLIFGGRANWDSMVIVVILVNLPLALLEGLILGFTIGFLARVKPEMLIGYRPNGTMEATSGALTGGCAEISPARNEAATAGLTAPRSQSLTLLIALLAVLASPSLACAHRLIGAYRVLPERRVQIQSFFDSGVPPRDATVKVMRPDKSTLAEGALDEKGLFAFHFDQAEDLSIEIRAAAGTIDEHTTLFTIPAKDLALSESDWTTSASPAPGALDEKAPFVLGQVSWLANLRDALIGIGFLLATAAFILSLRNARRLKAITKAMAKQEGSRGELPAPPQAPANSERSLIE
jgi:cobalt/nickel transport system permease protein